MNQMKSGKARGGCGIYAEMLKAGGAAALLWCHNLLCSILNTTQSGLIPTDWRRGGVAPICKGKGDTQECNNYRGVIPLSVTGKVLARILLDRVRQKLLTHQRHEQSGSTLKKSTVDRILAHRVLSERLRDFRIGLLAAYVDLREAFDSVNQDVFWRILALCGIPPNLVNLISGLYSGTKCDVNCDGTISDYFPVDTVVRQGCVLPQHTSTLAWTMYWEGCRRSRATECRSEQSVSLILTLRTTRLFSREQLKFLRGYLIR